MKVTINGEVFNFDLTSKPLAEALAVEKALGIPYVQYTEMLQQRSMVALSAFIWLVWRRNGRDVPYKDIESGAVNIDLDALEIEGDEGEGEDEAVGPTTPTPTASSTTGAGTSARSRKSSASARGSSGS